MADHKHISALAKADLISFRSIGFFSAVNLGNDFSVLFFCCFKEVRIDFGCGCRGRMAEGSSNTDRVNPVEDQRGGCAMAKSVRMYMLNKLKNYLTNKKKGDKISAVCGESVNPTSLHTFYFDIEKRYKHCADTIRRSAPCLFLFWEEITWNKNPTLFWKQKNSRP